MPLALWLRSLYLVKKKEQREWNKGQIKSNKNHAYELRTNKKRPSDCLDNYTEDHR